VLNQQVVITLGYVGTIDTAHGLDDIFAMMQTAPTSLRLRLVGRTNDEQWLQSWLEKPALTEKINYQTHVNYTEITAIIDSCDIVLAPAGKTFHSERYRSPLKIFDYMMRGKPIVAADVPSHRELLNEQQAVFYTPGDPYDLARAINQLIMEPDRANALARHAWQQGINYTYEKRAQRIIDLINERSKR
jgi:glycosyltransferase involved in cell wall biosynthesis